jgi:hypothetical protein
LYDAVDGIASLGLWATTAEAGRSDVFGGIHRERRRQSIRVESGRAQVVDGRRM